MNARRIVIILIIIAVLIAGGVLLSRARAPETWLVPAWQLTPAGRYSGIALTDPFVSWAPDGRSLLFSASDIKLRRDAVYQWNVGEKKLQYICNGTSPNYISNDEFVYLKKNIFGSFFDKDKTLILRNLSTGEEREFAPAIKKSRFWNEVTAFTYNPARRSLILRLVEFTRYYNPGTEEYDLSGRRIGEIKTRLSEGIVDWSNAPDGRCAALVEEKEGAPLTLQVIDKGKSRGRVLAEGQLSCVAWSPDGETIAVGESVAVSAVRPSDGKRLIVARFGDPNDPNEQRYVCRLSWSPDSRLLAVLLYTPMQTGDYLETYVLDMSNIRWKE